MGDNRQHTTDRNGLRLSNRSRACHSGAGILATTMDRRRKSRHRGCMKRPSGTKKRIVKKATPKTKVAAKKKPAPKKAAKAATPKAPRAAKPKRAAKAPAPTPHRRA